MIGNATTNANYNNYVSYEKRQQRLKLAAENATPRINTIADNDKRAVASEIQNRILHGDYGKEKMAELSQQLNEIITEHGDTNRWFNSVVGMSMRINIGTEEEPIWAALRGGNIFIHMGSLDDVLNTDVGAGDWVSPWVKLEDAAGLNKTIVSRLLQYQQFLGFVNGNAGEPVSWYLFDNLRDATSFFNDNPIAENADAFRSFANWLFIARAENAQEMAVASHSAERFVNLFFAQLAGVMDVEQSFLTAWNGIQPSPAEDGYSVYA